MRTLQVCALVSFAVACSDHCKKPQQTLAHEIHARYQTLSRDCTDDSQCESVGAVFGQNGRVCFNQCDLALAKPDAEALGTFIANDAGLQT